MKTEATRAGDYVQAEVVDSEATAVTTAKVWVSYDEATTWGIVATGSCNQPSPVPNPAPGASRMNTEDRLEALKTEATRAGDYGQAEIVDRIQARSIRLYCIETNEEVDPEEGEGKLVEWCDAVIASLDTTDPTGVVDYNGRAVYAWGSRDTLPSPMQWGDENA